MEKNQVDERVSELLYVRELERDNKFLTEKSKNQAVQIEQLRSQNAQAESDIERVKVEAIGCGSKLKQLETTNYALTNNFNEVQESSKVLTQENKALTDLLATANSKIAELGEKNIYLQKELDKGKIIEPAIVEPVNEPIDPIQLAKDNIANLLKQPVITSAEIIKAGGLLDYYKGIATLDEVKLKKRFLQDNWFVVLTSD